VASEVRGWRDLARKIPNAPIQEDALNALARKRSQTDGAALFAIIPRVRDTNLLRLLVAYQIIWDFLDSVNERGAASGQANGLQLHLALIDALDPERPISDYYRHHPWHSDGDYLRSLVTVCRESCARLPSHGRIRHLVLREAMRVKVLAINHDLDPRRRDATLEAWASREFPLGHEASWFELTGAASAGLTIFALLTLAASRTCTDDAIARTLTAYYPWISAAATMLDSYVDQAEDVASGNHVYMSHYSTPELATQRICLLVRRSLCAAGSLQDGEKHIVIVASMIAMYLSKDSALTPGAREATARILDAGGSLTRLLHPILRLWRTAYGLRSA
jgi:tetraprenyl-beta-curcumene synthase